MSEQISRPVPEPSELSSPYWQGLERGELLLQACAHCGKLRHYPRLLCDACYQRGHVWQAAQGHGRIHSWTIAHHAFHPGFKAELPYTLVTVDLDEGPRALGRWQGDALTIGMSVQAWFVPYDGGANLAFAPVVDD